MKQCILLSHVFIDKGVNPYDTGTQWYNGSNIQQMKIDQANFSVEHFRKNNPDAYIIVTGHGIKPNKLNDYCDYVYWQDELIKEDIGKGHPNLVNIGLNHAEQMGFSYIMKTRLDGVHLIRNIFDWCLDEIGDKLYLTTQATSRTQLCLHDLFNFGSVEFMKKCWKINNEWINASSGLLPHAKNYLNLCSEDNWQDALKNNCVIKDLFTLKWIDFRGGTNWMELCNKKNEMLDNNLENYVKYIWGSSEGYFVWNENGDLVRHGGYEGEWAIEKNMI